MELMSKMSSNLFGRQLGNRPSSANWSVAKTLLSMQSGTENFTTRGRFAPALWRSLMRSWLSPFMSTAFLRGIEMKITYELEVDSRYIRFKEATVTTKHLAEGIAADCEASGLLAGIEIPDAMKGLGDPLVFKQVTLENIALGGGDRLAAEAS